MNTRLKEIRMNIGVSQEDFGKKIRISRSHVAGLESGRKNLTDRLINDIVREYNINREWLINGSGDMFIDPLESYNLDDEIKELARLYSSLDDNMKKTIKNFIKSSLEEKDRD